MNPLQLGQQEEIFWCTFPRNSQYDRNDIKIYGANELKPITV